MPFDFSKKVILFVLIGVVFFIGFLSMNISSQLEVLQNQAVFLKKEVKNRASQKIRKMRFFKDPHDLLERLNFIAKHNHLNLKILHSVKMVGSSQWILIQFEGDYFQIISWMQEIQQLRKMIRVDSLDFKNLKKSRGGIEASLIIQVYFSKEK